MFATATIYLWAATAYPAWQPSIGRLAARFANALSTSVFYGGFAACLGIAILRYRLWDIDVIVRVNLDEVTQRLLAAVEETLQPAHSAVWLRTVLARPGAPSETNRARPER